MNRRTFLRYAFGCAGGASLLWGLGSTSPWLREARAAYADRILVVLFMRGGWDGLNVAVPHGDDAYYALRPTLAVPPPGSGSAQAALDLDGFFGFHPALASLHAMYLNGQVAVLPAVHYANASQSHFVGQDVIEHASTTPSTTGWLMRYLQQGAGDASQRALSLSNEVPQSLVGPVPVSAYADLSNLYLGSTSQDQTLLRGVIEQAYAWTPFAGNPHAAALHAAGLRVPGELEALRVIGQMPPEYGAVYPATTLGRQMRQTAGLVKARAGLDVITLNFGGWDTHRSQGRAGADGTMSKLLRDFSDSVSAFFTDLGPAASRVMLLAVTEFGRTAAENGSGGTDHGNASTWLAIGGGVRGGVHTGAGWPGLGPSQLYKGRYLAHSVEFRDVYGEVLTRFMGAGNLSAILPGYAPQPVGLVA